jgi:4-hydroxyphenylpyruvate dioxygenase-like putative hemolysin
MEEKNAANTMSRYALALDHIAICVEDLEESINRYVDKFGFELVSCMDVEGQSTGMRSAVIKANDVVLVLLQGTSPESQICKFVKTFGPGVQHVAITVSDLPALSEALWEKGVGMETEIIKGEGISQQFTIRDPSCGVRLEFVERRGGSFNKKSVEKLFRTMEANGSY